MVCTRGGGGLLKPPEGGGGGGWERGSCDKPIAEPLFGFLSTPIWGPETAGLM